MGGTGPGNNGTRNQRPNTNTKEQEEMNFLKKLLARAAGLPATIAAWRATPAAQKVIKLVKTADTYSHMSGAEKQTWVVDQMTSWAMRKGISLPESILHYLIEEAVQQVSSKIDAAAKP